MRSTLRSVLLVSLVAVGAACGGIDEDKALSEQLDGGDRSDFVDGLVEGGQGMLLRSEAQCWSDAVIEAGATPAELDAWSKDPLNADPTILAALTGCLEVDADVDAPLEGAMRDAFVTPLKQAGLTDEQVECVLTGFEESGFDARDIFLVGIDPANSSDAQGAMTTAIVDCQS